MAEAEQQVRIGPGENPIDRAFRRMDEARAAAPRDPVMSALRLADRAVGRVRDSLDRWLGQLQLRLSVRQARRDPGSRAWNDEINRAVAEGTISAAADEKRDPVLEEIAELDRRRDALLRDWLDGSGKAV